MPVMRNSGRVTLITLVLTSLVASVALAGVQPEILRSDREELRFTLELPEPGWRAGAAARPGEQVWEVALPGFVNTATPGRPRLPRSGGWLVVPPGTSPRLEVLRESWQPLQAQQLAIEPVPVLRRDEQTGEVFDTAIFPQPGQALPEDQIPDLVREDMRRPDPALAAGPAVRLGEVSWWRGRRIVSYTVLPVRATAEGLSREALRAGEWRVRFVRDPEAGSAAPEQAARRLGDKGDERFAGFLLNGELLPGLSTEAVHRGWAGAKSARPAAKGTPLGYADVRLPVLATQLHRVRASELVSAGLIPADTGVQESQIRLYQRRYAAELDDPADDQAVPYVEVEVPIHMVGEGDAFAGDDLFLFWGLRPRDDGAFTYTIDGTVYELDDAGDPRELSNEANIYWLQLADPDAGQSWARMERITLGASGGSPLTSYRRTDYFDEAVKYRENVPSIAMDRYYYNTQLDQEARADLTFWSPVPGQTGAELRAGLSALSNTGRNVILDLVDAEGQVAPLAEFFINSNLERIYQGPMPAVGLETPDVIFRMRNAITSLPVYSYLNWVQVSYDALYEAPFGRLRFPGGNTTGPANLEIPGFTTDDVGLVEITDPRNPRFVDLTGANIVPDGDGFLLSLQVAQPTEVREFYAATRMTSNGVVDVRYNLAGVTEAIVPTEIAAGSAEVLVVTHPEFRQSVEEWIEYRRERAGAEAYDFHVVEPQQLYDWYSGGLKSPWAIKRLVNHALDSPSWGTWALVLVGDSNENPRELGVLSSGRQWSRDWVPTHFHVQGVNSLPPEILGSDEWYANQDAGDGITFPTSMTEPPDLYVGRFPVNSNADFARLFAKIQQMENRQPGDTWRRRALFAGDDAWSSGTLSAEGFTVEYQPSEVAFRISERYMAGLWADNAGMVALEADTVWLEPFMEPLHPDLDDVVTLTDARNWCEESGAPAAFIAALSEGASIAHFQGHANHFLLTHEKWFEHDLRSGPAITRRDVSELTNDGKPFVFHGMGCHVGDWIQNVAHPSGNVEPGLGEKLLFFTDAGAAAVYASSGYEYLGSNRLLSELFIERMTQAPPSSNVLGEEVTSRWLLGELMWASEADVLANSQSGTNRAMVYQYVVLGDPLMHLDGGAPEVDAQLVGEGGGPIEGEIDLVATDESGLRQLTLRARDEAGIDQLRVTDTASGDLTSQVITSETPFYTNGSRQIMDYELSVPVRPFAHQLQIQVHDSFAPASGADPVAVTLNVEQDEVVTDDQGEPVDPDQFVFQIDEPVPLRLTVTSAAWFDDGTVVELEGENVALAGIDARVAGNHTLEIDFTATAIAKAVNRSVELRIDGFPTTVQLENGDAPPLDGNVRQLVNFPNPMRADTRFIFATNLLSGAGRVRVWTVSGRSVAEIPFNLGGAGQEVVNWDGRDREGDRLANGTYLYRVEIESSAGQVRSDMQRLVIMR